MAKGDVEAIRDPSELAISGKEQHGLAPGGLSPSCALARVFSVLPVSLSLSSVFSSRSSFLGLSSLSRARSSVSL